MKKVHLFLLASLVCFFSCSKNKNDDSSFHITCKVNGTSKSFNSVINGIKGTAEARGIAISAASAMSSSAEGFAFIVNDITNENEVTPGTYTDQSTTFQLLANYYGGSDVLDYHAGTEMYLESLHYDKPITNHFQVVISSIEDNKVRGTFNGDFYLNGEIEGEKVSITEGSFYVQLKEQQLP